ncbi:MAG: amidohydrolase family protein [Thermomicrobiales bacterium]
MAVAVGSGKPIIDCDVHQRLTAPTDLFPYLSRAYQERIKQFGLGIGQGGGYPNGGDRGYRSDSWPDDGRPPGSDLDLMRRQHLDPHNVEYAILLGQELRPIPTLPDPDYATALASAYNDWMIAQWLEKDERLKGAAIVATQDPRQAAKEIERVGPHPDIVGVLVPNGARFPYGQRYYDPIFEACVALDLPFVLHTGSEGAGTNGPPTPVGYPSYYVELRQSRSLAFQSHLASMIFEGLFERYPSLRVVFVEGGYVWLPTFLWHVDADWKALRRETPWVKRPPSEYVFEHCRFTSQPMESPDRRQQLLTVFEWARAEQTLMFASDYPHFDFDSPTSSLPPLGEELRRRVFSETSRECYKLPVRTPAAIAAC